MTLRVPYGILKPKAQAVWRDVVKAAGEDLEPRDVWAVEAFCNAVVRYRALIDQADLYAEWIKSDDVERAKAGADQAYKTGVLIAGAFKQVMHAANDLGLTPASRKRLGLIDDDDAPSAILEFLSAS